MSEGSLVDPQEPHPMRSIKTSIVFILLLLQISVVLAWEGRLGDNVLPSRQSVTMEIDPAKDRFRGRTSIVLQVKEPTSEIRLHALDITVTRAALSGSDGSLELTPVALNNALLGLKAPTNISAGDYTLDLEFEGPFNRKSVGLYKYFDQGVPYLSTQFEMTDARRAFPCFDEPIFKIPFQLTLIAPKGTPVFSNTPEVQKIEKDGMVVHRFHETPPIPTYLVAMAVGPYESTDVEGLGVPGRVVTTKGKLALSKHAVEVTPRILRGLEGYFDVKYPYQKLDQIGVTEFPFGAMENAGMVTYREDILLVNPATAQLEDRSLSTSVIAHELAHQWFGNLVTMKWWNDLWLNEAFATWMASKIVAQEFPELESALEPQHNSVMSADALLTSKPIRKPIRSETDIMDGLSLAYRKGEAALSMVERWIGEETFQKGMRLYMKRHRFANAEAADLWGGAG